ncbi:hypothetical protein [Candidatus Regiella insecticola]|uniref:hypothetical protein n=1 Tax=Candidatus Regiella insecticola TaxID=138073 RepID=UPI001F1C04E0|nr:hypothetical protein [Candidatus Regiella insecticola]
MSVDILRDSASTHSQQRGGFKGERYTVNADLASSLPFRAEMMSISSCFLPIVC